MESCLASSVKRFGRGIDATELLDQFLGLVVIGERVAADGQPGIVHQEGYVEVALLGGGMCVEFVREREEGGAPGVGRRTGMGHRARQRPLDRMARAQVLEDRHVSSSGSR